MSRIIEVIFPALEGITKMSVSLGAKLLFFVIWSSPTFAYYTTLDTGEILEQGRYKASTALQAVTSRDDGVNLLGQFDTRIDDESNLRAVVGLGTTDFQAGVFYKWIPIPDYENQPAIGIMTGVLYGRFNDENELSLRIHPIISKTFDSDIGKFIPYASIPFGLRTYDEETDVPVQLTLGTEFKSNQFEMISFQAEAGFDLEEAFSYIAIGAVLEIDDSEGVVFR